MTFSGHDDSTINIDDRPWIIIIIIIPLLSKHYHPYTASKCYSI